MAKSKATLETELRNELLEKITALLKTDYDTDDVRSVSASEIMIPLLDSERNEKFALIKVSIPRGTRDGNGGYKPYNGYDAADDYELELQEKATKKQASENKKLEKEKEKERKRKAKETIKVLNKEGAKKIIHNNDIELPEM